MVCPTVAELSEKPTCCLVGAAFLSGTPVALLPWPCQEDRRTARARPRLPTMSGQSIGQTSLAKSIREVLEILRAPEREPVAKMGEPELRFEPTKLLHRQVGLSAAPGASKNGGKDADRKGVIALVNRCFFRPRHGIVHTTGHQMRHGVSHLHPMHIRTERAQTHPMGNP